MRTLPAAVLSDPCSIASRIALALAFGAAAHAQHWLSGARWYDPYLGQMRVAADLDHDGDVDVVRFVGNTATTLLNSGSGEFAPGPATALPAGWAGPHLLIDLDNDGNRDLAIGASASYASGRGLLVFPGTGAGGFGSPVFVAVAGDVESLAEGEANGDGVRDVAIVYRVSSPGLSYWVGWLLGSPVGNYQLQPQLQIAASQYAQGIAAFDPDGNGIDDLAAVINNNVLRVLPTVGASPTLGQSFPMSGGLYGGVLAADVDGDLDDDLIVSGELGDQGRLVVVKTLPGPTFSVSSQGFAESGGLSFALGDLDGDGDPDLLGRSWGGTFCAFENVNAGVFARRWRQPFSLSAVWGLTALARELQDLDGDGNVDCVDANTIFFGSGTWADPGGSPAEGALGFLDMDGDGDLDLPQPYGLVHRNNGRGEFTAQANAWPPSFGQAIVGADFDGDGLQEMLVPRTQGTIFGPVFVAMHRVEDDGNGSFVDVGQAAPTGASIDWKAMLVDSNHDGVLDLVDVNGLWVNNGSHQWSLLGGALPGFYPRAVADLDGDGDDDCLGFTSPANLVVMHQIGAHAFAPVVVYAFSPGAYAHALGDLDDDGDLDIVVSPSGLWPAFAFSTFLNQGGTFVPGPVISGTFGAEESASGLLIGDVDGDGNTDLAAAGTTLLTVWRRSGPGLTYDAPRAFVAKDVRHLVDLDQDGDLDVTGEYGAVNQRYNGPSAGFQRQYGTAALGFGARRPTCSSVGIVRPNHTPVLRLANALGGSVALLGLGTSESNQTVPALPGLVFYTLPTVQLAVPLTGVALTAGAGGFDLPLPLSPGLAGATFFLQGYVLDPAAPSLFTHSNGLELHVGN